MKLIIILLFPVLLIGQTAKEGKEFKSKVDFAYMNAMKGVAFALENIPERKNSLSKDLIAKNKLIATIKINKEHGGLIIYSTGYYDTYKVTTEIYRDYNSLKEEGFIEYIPHD
jgi:hypothetical protein